MSFFRQKRVLVTGVCGTIGSALVRILLEDPSYTPQEIIGIDNNEGALFFIDQQYLNEPRITFHLADVRDLDKVMRVMKGVDIVFHAAALKHVVMCERSPFEAVQTNIHGVQNIIRSAYENNVEKVIFTSSDKAVNPTNVMGTSKLMGERLMTAANSESYKDNTIFASTRFGNVLGSSGSVIPIFHKQIAKGGPVTLTDPSMTRFVMTIDEAVSLVIDSVEIAKGGEVFVTKMPVMRIKDLAEVMISELAGMYGYKSTEIEIIEIGSKPGEKVYEELMSQEETRRTLELLNYFTVLPAFRGIYQDIDYSYPHTVSTEVTKAYVSSSEKAVGKPELRKLLVTNNLIASDSLLHIHPDQRYWPGDKRKG